jgi:hypothetical protein
MAVLSGNALKRPGVRRRLDAEVREHGGHHVGDARRRSFDADRE